MMSTALESREFVDKVQKLASESPILSVILKPIQNLVDHLLAIANIQERNEQCINLTLTSMGDSWTYSMNIDGQLYWQNVEKLPIEKVSVELGGKDETSVI